MALRPTTWRRIAIVLSVVNLGGLIMALGAGEIAHAGAHALVGGLLVVWIGRLRERSRGAERIAGDERLEGLEDEVDQLRRELGEAQERLDFTERMMARRSATAPPSVPAGRARPDGE
jgi:hypothetical protein